MKRQQLSILLLLGLVAQNCLAIDVTQSCDITLGEWQTRAAAPIFHMVGAAAVLDKKLFVFTGFQTNSLQTTTRLDIYDPVANQWTRGPDGPLNCSHIQAAAWTTSRTVPTPAGVGKTIYYAAGFVGNNPGPASRLVYQYDIMTKTYTKLPDLPEDRASNGLVVDDDNKLHFIGGLKNRDDDSGDHWVLDLLDISAGWKNATTMLNPRNHFQAVQYNRKLYLVGGATGHDKLPVDTKILDSFDLDRSIWEKKADLPVVRSHAEAATLVIGHRILMLGGRINQPSYSVSDRVDEYNPITDSWRSGLRPLPSPYVTVISGFFPNITVNGVTGDYVIMTLGGRDYNVGRLLTYASKLDYSNCTAVPVASSSSAVDTSSSASNSDISSSSTSDEGSNTLSEDSTSTSSSEQQTSNETSDSSSTSAVVTPTEEQEGIANNNTLSFAVLLLCIVSLIISSAM